MRVVRLLGINVLVLCALLVAFEGTSSLMIVVGRAVERFRAWPSINDRYLSLPMYRESPTARAYWGEFWRSSAQTYVDYLGWRRKDFTGRYINIVNGRRMTPHGQHDGPILGVFGGSAIWGTGVSDGETIPAWVSKAMGREFEVRNYGEAGYAVVQDFLRFYLALRNGEPIKYAVFYDGINDTYASCVNPGHDGATLEFARMKEKIEYRKGSDLRLADAIHVFSRYWLRQPPAHHRCEDDLVARKAAATMVGTWRTIQDFGAGAGVRTYFLLQPVAHVGNSDVSYLDLDETVRSSFERFYAHVDEQVSAHGIVHYRNLSQILSNRPGRYYIDFSHVIGEANHLIADAIVDQLRHDQP